MAPQRGYANFGFFFGEQLPDPEHLLVAKGIRMRHVKIRNLDDAKYPALGLLMGAAWKDAPNRFEGFIEECGAQNHRSNDDQGFIA